MVKCAVFSRNQQQQQQQHVDCGALMASGTGELFDGLNTAIHQLTSSLASQSQQQQQQPDIAYHHLAADHTSTVHPYHS